MKTIRDTSRLQQKQLHQQSHLSTCSGTKALLTPLVLQQSPRTLSIAHAAYETVQDEVSDEASQRNKQSQHHSSVLQEMLSRAENQKQETVRRRRPTDSQSATNRRSVVVSLKAPARSQAGALAMMLRGRACADLSLRGVMQISKALRVLAMTNMMLESHDSASSFVFLPVSSETHQSRIQQLLNEQRARHDTGNFPRLHHQFKPVAPHSHPDAANLPLPRRVPRTAATPLDTPLPPLPHTAVLNIPERMNRLGPEFGVGHDSPVHPENLSAFKLHVWSRQKERSEVRRHGRFAHRFLDLSLDARQPWRRSTFVAVDAAYGLADSLFADLTSQARAQQAQSADSASSLSSSSAHYTDGSNRQQETRRQARNREDTEHPTVVLSTDMSQSLLVFVALANLEDRLRKEGHSHQVVCSVYPAAVAPRVDSRNGFLFKVQLKPESLVSAIISRSSMQRTSGNGNGQETGEEDVMLTPATA